MKFEFEPKLQDLILSYMPNQDLLNIADSEYKNESDANADDDLIDVLFGGDESILDIIDGYRFTDA